MKVNKSINFEEELNEIKKQDEKINNENKNKINLISRENGKIEKFFQKKNIKFSLLNKIFEYNLHNMEKIYESSKNDLESNYTKELNNFKSKIKGKSNLIYFINLNFNDKKMTIGFYHKIKFSEEKLKSYKIYKDRDSFILFSENKYIFADEKKDAQFLFIQNYMFIIGFNNGGGLYLRFKTLIINFDKLSNQFKVSKSNKESFEQINNKNLFEYIENIQIFRLNSV